MCEKCKETFDAMHHDRLEMMMSHRQEILDLGSKISKAAVAMMSDEEKKQYAEGVKEVGGEDVDSMLQMLQITAFMSAYMQPTNDHLLSLLMFTKDSLGDGAVYARESKKLAH